MASAHAWHRRQKSIVRKLSFLVSTFNNASGCVGLLKTRFGVELYPYDVLYML